MSTFEESINNAEIAYGNRQYEAALEWYEKALGENPDSLDALSRVGAACMALKELTRNRF